MLKIFFSPLRRLPQRARYFKREHIKSVTELPQFRDIQKTFPKELFRGYNAEFRNCHSGSYVMKNSAIITEKKNHTILKK